MTRRGSSFSESESEVQQPDGGGWERFDWVGFALIWLDGGGDLFDPVFFLTGFTRFSGLT